MKLPNAGRALVEREKITEYLLNAEHSDNGGKARFFTAMGFRRDDWAALAAAFRSLALGSVAVQRLDSTHDEKICGGRAYRVAQWENATSADRLDR